MNDAKRSVINTCYVLQQYSTICEQWLFQFGSRVNANNEFIRDINGNLFILT